jgi:hypothetical protein
VVTENSQTPSLVEEEALFENKVVVLERTKI